MNVGLVTLRRLGVLVVILHAIVTIPHSIAHTNLHIAMDTWQSIYIFVVILIRSDSRRGVYLDTAAIWICTPDDFYDRLICFWRLLSLPCHGF
jgi:hypothetical protein